MSNGKNEMDIKFDELYIGQEYSRTFQVTEEKGRAFAEVSQDYNLLHLDEKYAQNISWTNSTWNVGSQFYFWGFGE